MFKYSGADPIAYSIIVERKGINFDIGPDQIIEVVDVNIMRL